MKIDRFACLDVEFLNVLLVISVKGQPLEQFDVTRVVAIWLSKSKLTNFP